MKLGKQQAGFTLVELLIAMAFFSFLLLFVTVGFVQVNRTYTRGITVKTIQETARGLIEDVARAVRTTEDITYETVDEGGYRLCFSGVRYAWNQHIEDVDEPENNQLANFTSEEMLGESEPFSMVKTQDGAACAAPIDPDGAEEVLDRRAFVQHLSLNTIAEGTYKLVLVISTRDAVEGDLAVFGREAVCKIQIGDQFCDVAKFETSVKIRN